MTKEREYRAYAGACVDLANKATNDKDKKHLLAAEAWRAWLIVFSGQFLNPTLVRCTQRFEQSLGGCLRVAALRGLGLSACLIRWPAKPRARCPSLIPWLLAPSGRNAD